MCALSTPRWRYPGKLQLETECSSKLSNVYPEQMMVRTLRNGAQGVQLWNAALDTRGGPKIGGGCVGRTSPFQAQDCIAPVTINRRRHTYRFTSDFWALAHFSRFVKNGAVVVDSTSPSSCPTSPASGYDCGLEDVAFRARDGSKVLVATAHDGKSHQMSVNVGGKRFTTTVPNGGIATFVWKD